MSTRVPIIKLLAACGFVGPILFTLVVVALSLLRSEYSHISQTISALGEVGRPNAAAAGVYIGIFGLLTMAYALGLRKGIRDGVYSILGAIFMGIWGLGLVLAGVFPCDMCSQFGGTPANDLHGFAATVAFFFGILPAPFFLWQAMKRDSYWQNYARFSLFMGVIILILQVVFIAFSESAYQGAFQRLLVGAIFVYMISTAIRLYGMKELPET